jgi:hypothetical protein
MKANAQSSWSIIIGLIIIVAASVAAWFLSPKGENQAYIILLWTPELSRRSSSNPLWTHMARLKLGQKGILTFGGTVSGEVH